MILLHPRHATHGSYDAPGHFPALMELYERNYIHMRRLLPVIPAAGAGVSRVANGLDLHLHVIERFRYTSELLLTYRFTQQATVVAEPNLRIRVYHDARMAEVMTAHLRHHPAFDAGDTGKPSLPSLQTRWRINRFLDKWLSYCLRQGHRFSSLSSNTVAPTTIAK